ncbi:MAG: hypothetical protein PHS14_02070 [Elusimicrobia bacterium]|nr:hypothetical protein [Elusimicrobiota bacterium]
MRRILSALTLVCFAGCAEIGLEPNGVAPPPAPRPILRPARAASATFGAGLIAHRKVDGLRVEIFVIGEGKVRGNLLSELKSPESRLTPPLTVVLIRHPKEGALLFGAGLPEDLGGLGARRLRGSALSPFKVSPGRDIVSRLAAQGVKPEDVRTVILPDLAPEWAGRAGAFPNATIILSSQAWTNPKRRALERDMPDPRAFIPEERLKLQDFSQSPPYGTFDHGIDLFKDGTVILIDLDGGAAGGMGAWINLDSGPMLLTGPAAFVYDNIFDAALPDKKFVVDISSFAWNARAMNQASEAAPRLVILPAHDLSTLKLSPRPDITLVP